MSTQQEGFEEQFKRAIHDRNVWMALSGKLTIGTLSGYLVGNFVKQLTDQAIWYFGLSALLVGGLHYMKWVEINWRQIDADALQIVEQAKRAEEEGMFERAKQFLIRTLPILGGFGTGFYYGFLTG